MPVVSLDGLIFSGLARYLNCSQANAQTPVYGMLAHLLVHCRDEHMVMYDDKS